jgi:AraC-like DNA-binding protein
MPDPTVAAGVTSKVVELAVQRGADRGELLTQSGISPALLGDWDARVPLTSHVALLRAAKRACGDPAFGLHYGEAVNLAEASVVGLIGYAAPTMLDAFGELARYSRLILDPGEAGHERFTLEVDAAGTWIVDHGIGRDCPELTEVAFAFGDTPLVQAVELRHRDPGYRSEYERILGAPVAFGCRRNAMRIDPAWLSHRVAAQPRYVFGVLTRHADAMLDQLDVSGTMRGKVEQSIVPVLHTGRFAINDVARQLGCSRDTLYRRLKAEGVTFSQVVDAMRYRLAREYLDGGKVAVGEVAYLVGFADAASFSRAFKRWSGRRPGRRSPVPGEARSGRVEQSP